jgi:hypothetical protein
MATLQEYMARRQMQGRSTSGLFGQSSQGKYWWEREREDEDVLTAARRAGLYGSISNSTAAQEKDEAGFWEKTWETGVDVVGNILSGAVKALEGVVDLGIGAVGAIGGIFDKGVRDEMRRWVEYDFTGENISSHFDRWSDDSIMNGSRAGRIVEGVIGGVGQLLPTVALSVATGGAALPSMLSVGASAAGNATEEAFQDGADYYRGMGYGLVSGGVEMGTEKLFGGLGNLMGGGMLDNVTRSVAKTGAARVVKEAVGEAAEEALAELVNPLAKSIYKGRDALSAYGERDYWSGVAESALVGGLTSVAYGGTVGHWTKTSGKYADVQAVKDEIEAIERKRENLDSRGRFSAKVEADLSRAERANLNALESILKKSSDKKRANLIKRGRLENLFESDGSIKESVIKRLDGAENSGASIYRREYYSSSLRGREDLIESDLADVGKKAGVEVKVFSDELSETAQKNYTKTKKALAALNRAGGNDVSLVITEASDKYHGGIVDGRTIYMPANKLEGGDYAATLVHEFTHFEEGTKEYSKMLDFLSSDDITVDDGKGGRMILRERAEAAVEAKGYGVTKEGMQVLLDKVNAGEELTKEEAKAIRLYSTEVAANETEMLLGNEAFIDRIVREDGGFAEKIVSRVLSLDKAFAKLGDKEAKAQHKIVRQAERLYLKAAEAAGNGSIQKMILSQVPELEEEVKVQMAYVGVADDGKKIYQSNFPKGTPKAAKSERILNYIQNVWSKKPITLVISNGETSRTIQAQFDPTIDETKWTHTDASKLAGGNRHGTASEQRVTLDLADDYYQIASDAKYNYSKEETGKESGPHQGVNMWHYFVNDIYFAEYGESEYMPYTVTINVKEKDNGDFVYSFNAEKEPSTRRTLHADVSTRKGANGELFLDNSIPHFTEKSTETTEKDLKNEKKVQMSLAEAANQQTSDDIDELMRSAGIEGDAAEIREDLAELYVKAENLAMDEDARKGKAFIKRVANRIALNMARLGTVRDGETQEAMAERLREEILSRSAFADKKAARKTAKEAPKQAPKKEASDEPQPKKTGYTYDDIHGMMDEVKKGLTFETSGGKSIQGELYRNDLWDVNKKIYQTLKAGELRKKRDVAREVAEMIVETVKVKEKDAYGKQITKRLVDVLSDEGVEAAKQEIALDVAVQLGDKEAKKYNKRMGDLKHEAQSLSDMKKGRYVNAANYKGDTFKKALSELSRINWRGGLVSSKKIRERFSELAKWYTPNNPLYGSGGVKNEMYRQSIADALDFVSDSMRGVLTMEDIDAAEMILKYFKREIENYGTIYKNGKREDAMPQVKEYIGKVGLAKEVASKSGILQGLLRNKITRMIADPALIMREADSFIEGGFFTEQFKELRRGTIEAAVKEHEIAAEFVKFWETNKAYGKRYNDTEIKYGGKKIPLQEAISLYMTMKREHAFAGLAYAGFEIEGKAGTVNVSDGFGELVEKHKIDLINALPPEKALNMTKVDEEGLHTGAIERAVADMQKELYAQFTAEDKRLITIMERGLEECREVKIKIDNILMGDSNVTGGYYFPIKRAGLAESIDVVSMFEGDRVSNLSFNKDTVKNAHKLLIEPVHIVYMRHVKAISLYDGLGVFTDNFNRMYNLNVSESANNPKTIRTEIAQSNKFVKETMPYFKELKQDIEGISKKRSSERFYNDAVAAIRSAYASYQLGANPKTWASQFSSLIASTSKLDVSSITKGMARRGRDVDKYCKLAWLRNNNGDAVLAQSVTTGMNPVQRSSRNALQKVRDVAMWPIGKVDRIVVERLFAACQVQVAKDQKLKLGTEENKIAAGKLLEEVILETQQNSLATERTAAMRSGDELLKGANMFIADAMKLQARMIEPYAQMASIRTQIRMAKERKDAAAVARLEKALGAARKQCVRSSSAFVGVVIFNALLAYGFKVLFRRDEEETVGTVAADAFGNMIGGIPFVRDVYSFFVDGYEMENFALSTINDVMKTMADTADLLQDAANGKDISKQEAMRAIRDVLYAMGQLSGVPTRNLYNNITGVINRVSPEAGYYIDGNVYKKSYSADLAAAIEADDEGMISLIASMMVEDKVGEVDSELALGLRELVEQGHDVLPRVLGDSITYDGEEIVLTRSQRERFKEVYGIAREQIVSMMQLRQYKTASVEVRARAIRRIWSTYWDLAVDDVLGVDSSEKDVLFAEAIDMDKLALIAATAQEIKADVNKEGKAISGTRLRKIEAFVEGLKLKAAQKYMIMGYLGYKNKNGEDKVRAYISSVSSLSKSEKDKLMGYAGYENG